MSACDFYKIKNIFFREHLWLSASALMTLNQCNSLGHINFILRFSVIYKIKNLNTFTVDLQKLQIHTFSVIISSFSQQSLFAEGVIIIIPCFVVLCYNDITTLYNFIIANSVMEFFETVV